MAKGGGFTGGGAVSALEDLVWTPPGLRRYSSTRQTGQDTRSKLGTFRSESLVWRKSSAGGKKRGLNTPGDGSMQVSHTEGGGGGGGQTASGRAGKDRDKTICQKFLVKKAIISEHFIVQPATKKQPILTETKRNTHFLLLLLWPNGSLCQCT